MSLFGDVAGYTPEDDKKALLLAALTGGLGLLGVRRNHVGEDLSRVGLGAVGTYLGQQDAAQSRYMHNLQAQQLQQMLTLNQQKMADMQGERDAWTKNAGAPGIPGYEMGPPTASGSMDTAPGGQINYAGLQRDLGRYNPEKAISLTPMVQQQSFQQRLRQMQTQEPPAGNASGVSPTAATPPLAGKPNPFRMRAEQMVNAAAQLSGEYPDQADAMIKRAKEIMPEVSTTKDATLNGQPVQIVVYKDGSTETLPYGVARKLVQVHQGDRTTLVDENSVAPGTSFGINMSPEQKDASARGWAQFGLNKNADARAAQQLEQGKWTNDLERGIQINTVTGESRPITNQGTPIGLKKDPKEQENLQRAEAVIAAAEPLIGKATGSTAGAYWDKTLRVAGIATEGAKAIAQLKTLEASLMMAQPRMEGQQSNLDVQMYREAAGQIGDPTVPREMKWAALQTIKALKEKYRDINQSQRGIPTRPAAAPQTVDFNALPK